MASAFQNRLVGTVALVAIAVIFLPDILDGEKVSNKDSFVSVPKRPAMQPIVEGEPFPHEQVAQAVSRQVEIVEATAQDDDLYAQTDPTLAEEAKDDASNAQDEVNDDGQPVIKTAPPVSAEIQALEQQIADEKTSAGWVVQLGVFRHDKNVKELLRKLQNEGYRAFSRKIQTSSGELTKVYVGPDVDKDKMDKALPHLKQITSLQGRVAEFTVN